MIISFCNAVIIRIILNISCANVFNLYLEKYWTYFSMYVRFETIVSCSDSLTPNLADYQVCVLVSWGYRCRVQLQGTSRPAWTGRSVLINSLLEVHPVRNARCLGPVRDCEKSPHWAFQLQQCMIILNSSSRNRSPQLTLQTMFLFTALICEVCASRWVAVIVETLFSNCHLLITYEMPVTVLRSSWGDKA